MLTEEGNIHGCELIVDRARQRPRRPATTGRGSAKARRARRFVADKHDRLCRCTHECNARTMILFDRANALPVLAAMAGLEARRSARRRHT